MVEQLVPDDLWALIQPVIPSPPPRPRGGRPRQCARQTLAGIVYLLRWGFPGVTSHAHLVWAADGPASD
ncbi:transposase, partial [Deinococcus radiotolerans]|uniref:transposase n=1 Tax=Deinococcus radiotolerans TaxID=1309407 RepID=UPI00166A8D89